MTATGTVSAIDIVRLRDLRGRFFADRTHGLEHLAADVTMHEWLATIHELRAQMAPVVALLPDTAFTPPTVTIGMDELWSAGQVIDHVCNAQRSVMFRFVDLVAAPEGTETPSPEAPADPRPLTRAESLGALEDTNAELDVLIDRLSHTSEPTRTIDNPSFGTLGIRGVLLFFAIHEYDHLGQLRT